VKAIPELQTNRLLLRGLSLQDAQDILSVYSDPEVTRCSEMVTLADLEQVGMVINRFLQEYETDSGIRWAIVHKTAPRVIGTCGVGWHRQNFSAFLSYDVAREFWNQGFATEAAHAVVRHCFVNAGVNRISATTALDNAASIRVLQKLGFQEEGVLREWGYWKGEFKDLRCFSLLRKETGFREGTVTRPL
jgi:ribosomal-protein-alanine N-acetyltransferase